MTNKPINISEALKTQRPNDRVIKILSNKFAIVQSIYDNGSFEDLHSLCGLDNGTVFFYGKAEAFGKFTNLKRWIEQHVVPMPNTTLYPLYRYDLPTVVKTTDNRKYKRVHRKILTLIS
jgi:hypothetical protein